MANLSTTALSPLPATQPALDPATTVLAIGVQAAMGNGSFGQPYIVQSIRSAATVFGPGRFVRAIGELFRQKATSVLAVVVSQEADLSALFDYLIDQPFAIVLPVGLTATSDRINTFANFAYDREQRGRPIQIVMPADPSPGVASLTASPVGALAGFTPTDYGELALGRYFVFTLDQVMVNPNVPSQYQADAAPSLAGLMATTPVQESIAYHTVAGVQLVGGYDAADCQSLANAGYTVLTNSARHGVVPYLGVTGTSSNAGDTNYSPYFHKLHTLRTAQYVTLMVEAGTDDIVGEPAPSDVSKTVDGILKGLQGDGVILAYDLSVTVAQLAGTISIDMSILVPGETTTVSVTAQVRQVRQ